MQRKTVLFFKAHVRAFTRTLKNGKIVNVRSYDKAGPGHSKEVIDLAVQKRLAGMSYSEISKELGVSHSEIERAVKRNGAQQYKIASESDRERAIKMYEAGKSPREISYELGFSRSAIGNWIAAAGKRRSLSEAGALAASLSPSGKGKRTGKHGAFHSKKTGNWEFSASTYEYIRMHQLDNDPDVVTWGRAKDRITYELDGKTRYYVPDLIVERSDGSIIVEEVKPASMTQSADVQAKADAAESFYRERGIGFRVITEDDIGRDVIANFDWTGFSKFTQEEAIERRRSRVRDNIRRIRAEKKMTKSVILLFSKAA